MTRACRAVGGLSGVDSCRYLPASGPSASRPRRCPGSSSRRCTRRTGQAPRLRAPRRLGSPAECGSLSAGPRPSALSFLPSRTPGQPGWLERVGAHPAASSLTCSAQQLSRLDLRHRGELGDDFQARVTRPFLQFAHVGAVDPRLIGQVLLRDPLRVPQPAQIGVEGLPEVHRVHAATGRGCSTGPPL
jgi:hypothetical protein